MTWTLLRMSSKLSKVISSLCKHSAACRHLSEYVFLTASLLSGISGILHILCTTIYFNGLDKVNDLINVCVLEIPWARFPHWRSFQFSLALPGAEGSPALISAVELTGCWRHDNRDGSILLHAEMFVSRCLSHSASWEQLFCPRSCLQILQGLSSSVIHAVFDKNLFSRWICMKCMKYEVLCQNVCAIQPLSSVEEVDYTNRLHRSKSLSTVSLCHW